jgi:hypothetical protein
LRKTFNLAGKFLVLCLIVFLTGCSTYPAYFHGNVGTKGYVTRFAVEIASAEYYRIGWRVTAKGNEQFIANCNRLGCQSGGQYQITIYDTIQGKTLVSTKMEALFDGPWLRDEISAQLLLYNFPQGLYEINIENLESVNLLDEGNGEFTFTYAKKYIKLF